MRRFALVALSCLFVPSLSLLAADPLDGLDAAVNAGLKAHGVAGVSIAIVKNGRVIHVKGYGVRTVGQSDPVTEHTLFAIGSVTKSFTATALGMLVDEKKLRWNDPLSTRVKNFRLDDPYISQEATIRDALSHRTGYARNELVWYGSPFNREQLVSKMARLKPDIPFRTGFRYNNLMYLMAGQTIPQATGKSWDDFVTERIFQPLRMESTLTSVTQLAPELDVATPHEKVKGKPKPVDWKNIDNIGPAGSILSSASDMAEYVKFHLSGGKAHGKRLLELTTQEELFTPQNLMPKPAFSFNEGAVSHAYGFGWMLSDFKGKPLAEHGGNIDGMTAQVGMLPSEKIGVVILANGGQSLLPMALMYDLLDRMTGEPNPDRAATTGFLDVLNSVGMEKLAEPNEATRIKDTKPSLALKKYAGKYQDDKHAELAITFKDDKLT
ncbi:MAG: serine hydrolase, partial [Gemmataceae bacterium]